ACNDTSVLTVVDGLPNREHQSFLARVQLVEQMLVRFVPGWTLIGSIELSLLPRTLLGLIHHVHHPCADRLNQHLRTFAFEKGKHVEVAVTFCGLRPKFTDNLYDRFHTEMIDLYGVKPIPSGMQRLFIGTAIKMLVHFAERVDYFFPAFALVGGNLLGQ